jgi:signal transduction histidine kinase
VTLFLIALVITLTLLLLFQRMRTTSNIRRLSEALSTHDRRTLGDGPFHRSPPEFRALEKQLFEQLFETESLEQRIVRREDLITTVVEGLADAVIVFDGGLNIRFTNHSACNLFGWQETPVNIPVSECIGDLNLIELFGNSVTNQQRATTEISYHIPGRDNDPPRILEVDVAPLTSTRGNIVNRARAVLHDVTEARHLERVRRDFVANASHELRTPLTIINGYLENLMEDRIADHEASLRFISVMHKHGKRIARIIEDMLTISKLESHTKEAIQSSAFDLNSCASEVIDRLKPMLDAKKAELLLDIPSGTMIVGDAFYWDQILFNLIENAIKQNDAEGLEITVGFKRKTTEDVIFVRDDGVGIPVAAQEFIFKRFYRVDQNRGAEKKGTGLGLSIVKRAVEAHGGEISVDSIPGVNTTFSISLPREKDKT